jgi:hypothetical protein
MDCETSKLPHFLDGGGAYATERKVASLAHDEVIGFFFNWPNPSSRTMALG